MSDKPTDNPDVSNSMKVFILTSRGFTEVNDRLPDGTKNGVSLDDTGSPDKTY